MKLYEVATVAEPVSEWGAALMMRSGYLIRANCIVAMHVQPTAMGQRHHRTRHKRRHVRECFENRDGVDPDAGRY